MGVVAQRLDHRHASRSLLHQRIERLLAALVVDELVDMELGDEGPAHAVVGVALFFPRFDVAPMRIPEIRRQVSHAGVEEIGVLQHLVVVVVLGGEPDGACLDPHVDVFRHQHHLTLGFPLLQRAHHGEDLVIGLAGGQRRGQRAVHRLGLQEQAPFGALPILRLDDQAGLDVSRISA